MFREQLCLSSGGQILLAQQLVSSLSLGDCLVQRLQEGCRNLCTEHIEEYIKCIKIKNLCIELVKKYYHYIMMHRQRNIKNILVSLDLARTVGVEWCDHKFCGKESNLI